MLRPKRHLTWKHKIATPIDYVDIGYSGPSWKIVEGFKTWIGLNLTGKVETALGMLGIYVGLNMAEVVSFENTLYTSPVPKVSLLSGDDPLRVGLRADINDAGSQIISPSLYQGWTVWFLATRANDTSGSLVASATLNATGQAIAVWDTVSSTPGDYKVRAYVLDPASPTSAAFPYVSSAAVEVSVVAPQALIQIVQPTGTG